MMMKMIICYGFQALFLYSFVVATSYNIIVNDRERERRREWFASNAFLSYFEEETFSRRQ